MSINIGEYSFEGPYTNADNLQDRSGIYVILCETSSNKYNVVDVGESATVKSRIENHDRADCWKGNCSSTLNIAVYYTPQLQQSGRKEIEKKLRNSFNPPCGER